jgi:hypothetical protein
MAAIATVGTRRISRVSLPPSVDVGDAITPPESHHNEHKKHVGVHVQEPSQVTCERSSTNQFRVRHRQTVCEIKELKGVTERADVSRHFENVEMKMFDDVINSTKKSITGVWSEAGMGRLDKKKSLGGGDPIFSKEGIKRLIKSWMCWKRCKPKYNNLKDFSTSEDFDFLSGGIVVLNAIWIGVQTGMHI